jgi:hypothetical protein
MRRHVRRSAAALARFVAVMFAPHLQRGPSAVGSVGQVCTPAGRGVLTAAKCLCRGGTLPIGMISCLECASGTKTVAMCMTAGCAESTGGSSSRAALTPGPSTGRSPRSRGCRKPYESGDHKRGWRLRPNRPVLWPRRSGSWSPIHRACGIGQALVRTLVLFGGGGLRNLARAPARFIASVPVGEVMRGIGVGDLVIASRRADLRLVSGSPDSRLAGVLRATSGC